MRIVLSAILIVMELKEQIQKHTLQII